MLKRVFFKMTGDKWCLLLLSTTKTGTMFGKREDEITAVWTRKQHYLRLLLWVIKSTCLLCFWCISGKKNKLSHHPN